jgi:hypothetical protein
MRKLFGLGALLLCVLAGTQSFGTKGPFTEAEDQRFRDIETGGKIINTSVSATAAIDWSKMAALTDAQILVGNGSNVAVDVAVSGDVTMANTGAVTIAANAVEESMLAVATADGLHPVRVARATFACTTNCDVDTGIVSGVNLPAKALIKKSWFYINTQFVDGGAGTIAFSCEDANNIYTAADISGVSVGAVTDGNQDGAGANMTGSIAATCDLTLTASGAEPSAGNVTLFVEYTVHD